MKETKPMPENEPLPEKADELMPRMLKIAPGFKQRWQEHLQWWDGEPAGDYNDIGVFARYVVDAYDEGDTSWFKSFFDFVERLLVEGNEEMREFASIGFLEDIQTISSWREHKGRVFLKWLGPQSKKRWHQIDELWRVSGGSLAGVLRTETQHLKENQQANKQESSKNSNEQS